MLVFLAGIVIALFAATGSQPCTYERARYAPAGDVYQIHLHVPLRAADTNPNFDSHSYAYLDAETFTDAETGANA